MVTGASGFLGRRLVKTLLNNNAFVIGIDYRDNPQKKIDDITNSNAFKFISGSFGESLDEELSELISEDRKKSAIFHMAGMANVRECEKDPAKAFQTNVGLTVQVLDFCLRNKIEKFIFPSTGLVYGDSLRRPACEEDSTYPINIYTATKLSAEAMIKGFAKNFGLCCSIVRLSNVYGPGISSDTVMGTILAQAKTGGTIEVRDLTPVRDYIYIDDAMEGLVHTLVIDNPGYTVINLSTGIGLSVRDLAETVCRITSIPVDRIHSNGIIKNTESVLVLDNSYIYKITGWKPKYTPVEGLSLLLKGCS